jgi:putative ABC transport system permease protein
MVFGRLKDGISIAQAQADLQTVAAHLASQYPNTNGGHEVRVVDLVEDLASGSTQFLAVLMGAALFVLLLCCANVANLQLARLSSRQREVALRTALGAGRWRIGRQLLVESIFLALLGSAAALLLASWGLKLVGNNLPPFVVAHVAGLKHLGVDSRVFLFTLGIAALTGVLTGLAPALQLSRPQISDTLKEGGRGVSAGRHRLRTLLVISEVALSLLLLVGAGTMVAGFRKMIALDMGFDRSHVLTFEVSLPQEKYRDHDRIRGYYEQVLRRIQALPGVESAACLSSLPSGWSWNWTPFEVEGKPAATAAEIPSAIQQVISPGFFSALHVPLRQGRLVTEQDGKDAPAVAVISESMAQRNWPNESPLGKHVRMGQTINTATWRTVVGVVGDVSPSPFNHDPSPTMYVPIAQHPELSSAFAVRVAGDPLNLASSLNAQLRAVDADEPAYDIRSLEQVVSDGLSGVQTSAYLMLVFGACALILAAAGIFAVMTYSVAQRTREIGIRMAIGANRADVLRVVLGTALKMSAVGLAIGLILAFLMTHALSSVLFGIVQTNLTLFAALTVLLILVATFAAYLPARWAMRVDPMVALRYE